MEKIERKYLMHTLAYGIEKYVEDNNLKSLVIGLSGGIDSTVCAALCYIAKENLAKRGIEVKVYGASLPCSSNEKEENDIAFLCRFFCDDFHVTNLDFTYRMVRGCCEEGQKIESTPISQGNIKARLRMIYLYNMASLHQGIVIDTDNLTESFLGFWTIHGDEGDFNPIGSLWKTEVYILAKALVEYFNGLDKENPSSLNNLRSGALTRAIAITPTDGNGVKAGGDLAQIAPGHTYDDVDEILKEVVPAILNNLEGLLKERIDKLCKKYDRETVEGIVHRMKASSYKRRHRPLVIDLKGETIEKSNVFEKRISVEIC